MYVSIFTPNILTNMFVVTTADQTTTFKHAFANSVDPDQTAHLGAV